MVQRKIDKNQSKLGIVTLDSNIPKDHISRFVVDFIDEIYPMLNIKEPEKKKGRDSLPIDSMLKLLVYAKIKHWKVPSILQIWQDTMRFIGLFLMMYDHQNAQFKGIEENTAVTLKHCFK